MIKLNIHEAKTHLSRYLKHLEAGETILLCRHNVPIAEIRPLPQQRTTPRPLGTAKGKVKVPPEFFEPLPEEMLRAFEGQGS
jgi:antitoxin (DNA-binding transcriptional repressor) of toxin-antitoxin stability system